MTAWRPSSQPDAARRRADLLERARTYFAEQDVLAVDTPALGQVAGSDPHIESLSVRSVSGTDFFLHTSPESCMKRLLAAGYPDIYSICRVYRDGETGRQHLTEFTMIEWYRLGFDLAAIISDATTCIATCLEMPELMDKVVTLEYRDAFMTYAGIEIASARSEELAKCVAADDDLRERIGDDRDTWLDLILGTIVAPRLPPKCLTVLQHYPASKAALARLCPDDNKVADRFEIFFGAMELANGYVELRDAEEQRHRFEQDQEVRRSAGQSVQALDFLLLQALESGLPDCAGVAIGVERLQMLHDRTENIRDVVTFDDLI